MPALTPLPNLSVATVGQWKSQLIDEAFSLNAYGILEGTESPPAANEARLVADYNACRSALIGLIRKSLDASQKETVIAGIDPLGANAIYKKLLDQYEPKTAASRMSVMQEIIALRKKDDEAYSVFGARAIELGNRLQALLPQAPSLVPVKTQTTAATPTASSLTIQEEEASLTEGYTAADLC